jgi:hypothetical protein
MDSRQISARCVAYHVTEPLSQGDLQARAVTAGAATNLKLGKAFTRCRAMENTIDSLKIYFRRAPDVKRDPALAPTGMASAERDKSNAPVIWKSARTGDQAPKLAMNCGFSGWKAQASFANEEVDLAALGTPNCEPFAAQAEQAGRIHARLLQLGP